MCSRKTQSTVIIDLKRTLLLIGEQQETYSCRPAIFVHGRNDESTIFFDQRKLSKQTSYWSKPGFFSLFASLKS